MNTQLDSFETALLHQLQDELARQRPQRARPTRRLAALGATAAAAIAGVLIVPGLGPTPAYSVQEGNAGEIRVEINAPEDAAGLERALEEHGIAADITYLSKLQTCAPGRYTVVSRTLTGLKTSVGDDHIAVMIPPGAIREGETFVLAWSAEPMAPEQLAEDLPEGVTSDQGVRVSLEFDVATGPVAPCRPAPAKPGEPELFVG